MLKKISLIMVVLAVVVMLGSLALAYPQPQKALSPPISNNAINTTDDQSPPLIEIAAIPGFCLTNNSLTNYINSDQNCPATNMSASYVNTQDRIAELIMTRFAPFSKQVDIFGIGMKEFGTFGGFYIGDLGEGGNIYSNFDPTEGELYPNPLNQTMGLSGYPSTGDAIFAGYLIVGELSDPHDGD